MKVLIITILQNHRLVPSKDTPESIQMRLDKLKVVADSPLFIALEKRE